MNRRNFLQALGLGGGVSALSACGIDDNRYYTPVEQILPYVTRPEQITPGTPTFFATSVLSGPDAWPALSNHRDGRVVMVGANIESGLPAAVSSSSLFELQKHYSPDRMVGPGSWAADGTIGLIGWTAALEQLKQAISGARSSGKKVAYLGPYKSGTIVDLLQQATNGNATFWEPLGRENEAAASKALFGAPFLPKYDLSGAHYVLSFGAPFLADNWGGAGSTAQFAAAKDPNQGHFVTRFCAVTPVRDTTASNSDDWMAVKPGSEALVALAIAKLVAAKTGYNGPAKAMVAAGDPAAAAAAAGIDAAEITKIAELFAAGNAVALPGGTLGASTAGTELAAATYLLNIVGKASGKLFSTGGYRGPIHSRKDIDKLIAQMTAGKIGVLLIDDVDPVHNLPNGKDFLAAMAKVGLTVAVSSHPTETNAKAKLLMPCSDSFEDWGDEEPWAGMRILRQPSQTALWDTRSLGDVLLATAGSGAISASNWHEYLQKSWAEGLYKTEVLGIRDVPPVAPAAGEAPVEGDAPAAPKVFFGSPGFKDFWRQTLQRGVHVTNQAKRKGKPAISGNIKFSGAAKLAGSGDLSLVAFPHHFLNDGRYANQPWAQEMPDPLTGQVWDTWALLSPATAKKLGVIDNDLLALTTAKGTIEVGVEVTPLVADDVVAVPFGGGHTRASGRYAENIGVNVVSVLDNTLDAQGCSAWQQQMCSASKKGEADLVSTFGGDTDLNRGFAVACDADALAKVGDKPAHHPGELTGIKHLELDPRLKKAGLTDFYGLPEHPAYRFGMTIDTNACTGCGACSVACYAENNLPVIGKVKVGEGREMGWIRVNRYFKRDGKDVHFTVMMCQQCGHAPCESVCPVLATYHTIDGLNAMIYNRCVGTRYCSNACPFSARKFNYHSYVWPEPFNLQLNPDVVSREMGVMEKCTFCVQRIRRTKSAYRDAGFRNTVPNDALTQLTACAEACPSQAITFGNLNDDTAGPAALLKSARNFAPLADLNVFSAINFLAKASYHHEGHGGGHEAAGGHGDAAEPGGDHSKKTNHEPAPSADHH